MGIFPARPAAAIAASGLVDAGAHNYTVTYVINGIEHTSQWRSGTTTLANGTVNLSGISNYSGPQAITYKRLYRTLMPGGFTGTCTISGGALTGGTVTAAGTGYQATPIFTPTTKDAGSGGSATIVVGGLGGTVEPTWNTTTGTYTLDNLITWVCSGAAAGTEETWKASTPYTYVSIATDTITTSGTHGWNTAQRVVYTAAGTSAIGNLTSGTTYFVIITGTGTEIKLATTAANAASGTQIVLGAKSGSGTITFQPTYYVSGTANVVKNVAGTYKFTAVAGTILSFVCSGGSGYTVAPNITITKHPLNDQYKFYKVADLALGDTTYSDTKSDIELLTINVPLPTGMSNTILLGMNATGTGSSQFVIGDSQNPVSDSYFGGVFRWDAGAGLDHIIHGMGGNGTDRAGGALTLAGGKGTGTGLPGPVVIQTAPASTTGSVENTLVTQATFGGPSGRLLLPAGSATAGTAPLKFTSGPLTTAAVAGQIEYLSGVFYFRASDTLSFATISGTSLPTGGNIITGQKFRLTANDAVAFAGPGEYTHDGTGWICTACWGLYPLGNLGAAPTLTLIPGCEYTAVHDQNITTAPAITMTRTGGVLIYKSGAFTIIGKPTMTARASVENGTGAWTDSAAAKSLWTLYNDGTNLWCSGTAGV